MQVWWFLSTIVYLFRPMHFRGYPWLDQYFYPGAYTTGLSPISNGTTKIADTEDTPDFRIEEPDFVLFNQWDAMQYERPYRNSPAEKQAYYRSGRYWRYIEKKMACYCCATYRRHIVLSTCAVITTRHILTTATPTALILRSYSHLPSLENILGGWYDNNANVFNASMYMTPARIHFHPNYANDYQVNMSHPIPCMYDLAIWAATYPFLKYSYYTAAVMCPRASSSWSYYTSSTPFLYDTSIVAGYMFMKAYHRRPMPWFRYIVKTQAYVWPCPKSDWQWFHCIQGEYWGRYGFDSGGGMNTAYRNLDHRTDGLAGICAFSMKLRSKQTTHYFTVVDNYPVLDFMYDAFLGLTDYVYLDDRFENTKWRAPIPWWGEHIPHNYEWGEELYAYAGVVPYYRR